MPTFSLLISSIWSLLNLVPNFEVKFVKRQKNMVALVHTSAKAAYFRPSRYIFESIEFVLLNKKLKLSPNNTFMK
jgi:hypothetical protein